MDQQDEMTVDEREVERLTGELQSTEEALSRVNSELKEALERAEEAESMLNLAVRFRPEGLDHVAELFSGKEVRGPTKLAAFANACVQTINELATLREQSVELERAQAELEERETTWVDLQKEQVAKFNVDLSTVRAELATSTQELARFRERETLVQELVTLVDKINQYDAGGLGAACGVAELVRDFKVKP